MLYSGRVWAGKISIIVFTLLIPCGLLFWPGWIVFALLALLLGLRHPPPLNAYSPFDQDRLFARVVRHRAVHFGVYPCADIGGGMSNLSESDNQEGNSLAKGFPPCTFFQKTPIRLR